MPLSRRALLAAAAVPTLAVNRTAAAATPAPGTTATPVSTLAPGTTAPPDATPASGPIPSSGPIPAPAATTPPIRPRSDWAGDLAPTGPLVAEDDVRFLLVHHTATPNTDAPERTPERLRSIFGFHTGAERGWPDVAYNFFVDRYGVIWEGRAGSIDGPVRGDASGGSQGHAQLCSFVGDFTSEPPPPVALAAMTHLLAWLAVRDGVDLAAPVEFASRGSNRWPRGVTVRTDAVAGHRDMSLTTCPGDALYPLIREQLGPAALALTRPPEVLPPPPPPTPAPSARTPEASAAEEPAEDRAGWPDAPGGPTWWAGAAAVAATAVGVTGAVAVRRSRRSRKPPASSAHQQPDGQRDPADGEGADEPDEESADGH